MIGATDNDKIQKTFWNYLEDGKIDCFSFSLNKIDTGIFWLLSSFRGQIVKDTRQKKQKHEVMGSLTVIQNHPTPLKLHSFQCHLWGLSNIEAFSPITK